MRPLRVAVIGAGFIGPVHVEAIRRLGHVVAGVLGPTPARSQAVAAAWGVPRAYASLDDLLDDDSIHVVHIASPNRCHFEQARRALLAGKHVICEKPLALTSAETAELVDLARGASGVAAVCYNVRFYPLCLEARQRRLAGDLGPIYHVTGSYLQDWLLFDTDFNWRVQVETGGELRAVADIGTHWLDLIAFVTGLEVEAVCADLRTVHSTRFAPPAGSVETFQSAAAATRQPVSVRTDDYGSILLRFRGGARGALTVSQVVAGRKNCIRFDIAGARASLAWDSEEPNTMLIGHRDRPNELLTRDPALLAPECRPFAAYPGGHAEGFPDTFKQLFRAVYETIETGATGALPFPTFADGHREVQLGEAILKSHRESRWVDVAPGTT
jgi:predicted dehydrogenase